ncbi:hypothetical protein MJ1_0713 [Nanobdella aerobiophila]|uniref:Uncharacterized protein n=1 Tax=Nanobdella aerobiophila TaxID=2586965 RepID=A0A915SFL9_9ARCH|nr:hypothetical protein [Nanobdella aerobiophila]BBL45855.1 hypothetical protein MJ1_0713 [Nanobdella aerobiophila]
MVFYNIFITLLTNIGFFNIIVPFLLVYAVMYGLLSNYKIIGDPFKDDPSGKAVRSIISMIAAATGFLVVGAANIVLSLNQLIPYIVLFILTVFFLLIAISPLVSKDGKIDLDKNTKRLLVIIAVIIFSIVLIFSLGLVNYLMSIGKAISNNSLPPEIINFIETIVILLIMFGIVFFTIRTPKAKEEKKDNSK